jgi:hypothetical protein
MAFQERRLEGAFYEFIHGAQADTVVVLHELGALCVDGIGGEIWRVDTDVVEDVRVTDSGDLILSIMNNDVPVIVRMESGDLSDPTLVGSPRSPNLRRHP